MEVTQHEAFDAPAATIIILTKNGGRYLDEALAAIRAQATAHRFEILLIDSGSVDGTLQIATSHGIQAHQIAPASFNHGATRNLGGRLAHPASRFLVFLTQDATPLPGWLDNLIAPLEADPCIAGAFSRHVPRADCNPILARQMREDWEQCGTPERVVKRIEDTADYERRKIHYVYFANTSSCIRRSVWEQYPFPTTDFAEDAQWAEKVLSAGYTLLYEPASQVLHSHSFPLLEHSRRNRQHARAMRALQPGGDVPPEAGSPAIHLVSTMWRDWRSLWQDPEHDCWWKMRWSIYSPLWHGAAGVGSWLGGR